jgi:hypothetical protein
LPGRVGLRQQSPASHFIPEGLLPLRVNSAPGKTSVRSSTWSPRDTPDASTSRQSDQEAVPSQQLSTVSLGFLDPFGTLPGDPPKRVGNIIHHCELRVCCICHLTPNISHEPAAILRLACWKLLNCISYNQVLGLVDVMRCCRPPQVLLSGFKWQTNRVLFRFLTTAISTPFPIEHFFAVVRMNLHF